LLEFSFMKGVVVAAVLVLSSALAMAQEQKPVPKDSVRVSIPGCTRGYMFTAGRRTSDQPGTVDVPEGTHIRMNGPKKMMAEIKAHEGSMIEITGLMKRGQVISSGVPIGGGVRIGPGPANAQPGSPVAGLVQIDLEGWRSAVGNCPSR
jgi:hypothetical protein